MSNYSLVTDVAFLKEHKSDRYTIIRLNAEQTYDVITKHEKFHDVILYDISSDCLEIMLTDFCDHEHVISVELSSVQTITAI